MGLVISTALDISVGGSVLLKGPISSITNGSTDNEQNSEKRLY